MIDLMEKQTTDEPVHPLADDVIEGLNDTKLAYHALVMSVPEEKWRAPTGHPTWTVADILYHMVLALRYLPSDIRLIRKINRLPKMPAVIFHRWNDWNTRRGGRKCTKDSLLADYDEAHGQVVDLAASLSDLEWRYGADYPGWDPMLEGYVTFEELFRYPVRHFNAHLEELKIAFSSGQG